MFASGGVHIYTITRKLRGFAVEGAMSNVVASLFSVADDGKNLSLNDRRRFLDTVGSLFANRQKEYWPGE